MCNKEGKGKTVEDKQDNRKHGLAIRKSEKKQGGQKFLWPLDKDGTICKEKRISHFKKA